MKRSMTATSSKAGRGAIAALLLCAFFGAARAQQLYEPPVTANAAVVIPLLSAEERAEEAATRALAERRQNMIDDCEQNHGIDCEREVDTELRAEGQQWGAHVVHLRPAR